MPDGNITPTRWNSNVLSFKTCSNIFAARTLPSLMFALYSPTCCISYSELSTKETLDGLQARTQTRSLSDVNISHGPSHLSAECTLRPIGQRYHS